MLSIRMRLTEAAVDQLSCPVERIRAHYSVVVVGSGYGGAIAAARLARAGQAVCLLERGRELRPGDFPTTAHEATEQFQVSGPEGHVGSPLGLYDLHANVGMSVFVGCGLGGTSLINAGVALKAEPRVFQDPRWPASLRTDPAALDTFYERACAMLEPAPYPEDRPALAKLGALQASAERLGGRFYRPPINVTFADRVNRAGVSQPACTLCGDCVSGCNTGAKNTLLMNYLPDAVAHGAEIYTQISVRWVERQDNRWIVHYRALDTGREAFDAPEMFVGADVVVLAAGTLGSTEILLRSREHGLATSGRLGHRFTGNGDVLAFSYNAGRPIDGIGFGHHDHAGRTPPVGPCIAGIVDLREQPELRDGMVIEEGSIPGALGSLLPPAFSAIGKAGANTATGVAARAQQRARELESLVLGSYTGAVRNTQTYLVMTHDQDDGVMRLDDDQVVVDWKSVGDERIFQLVDERLHTATAAIEGIHVRDPLWSELTGDSLISVHPLGGCVIADDAAQGVVDDRHRVYAGESGQAVHDGLYVADGSVVPCPLGVNPLLTISALAERAVALLASDRGWAIDDSAAVPQTTTPAPATVGIEFTERMQGWYSTDATADYDRAAELGRQEGCELSFTLTIVSRDVDTMLRDPQHTARMTGTVTASHLSASPLQVEDGEFHLFVDDPADPTVKRMRYRMRLVAEDGTVCFFDGFKLMRDSNWTRLWPDTTTLYVTLSEDAAGERPLARGVLNIAAPDFARQLTTTRAVNASSEAQRLEALARFGTTFAGVLFHTYGGLHLDAGPAAAPPRKRRELRLPVPDVHPLLGDGGARSLLTRYAGGGRGPVLLVPGAAESSALFTLDTLPASLAEYLWLDGRDVWLLDHRGSHRLGGGASAERADLAADVRLALRQVRHVTGAGEVAVLGHGTGSAALLEAALAGDGGIAVAVCVDGGRRVQLSVAPDCGEDCVSGPNAPRDSYRWLADHLVAP
jgi:cholesterol oxidase